MGKWTYVIWFENIQTHKRAPIKFPNVISRSRVSDCSVSDRTVKLFLRGPCHPDLRVCVWHWLESPFNKKQIIRDRSGKTNKHFKMSLSSFHLFFLLLVFLFKWQTKTDRRTGDGSRLKGDICFADGRYTSLSPHPPSFLFGCIGILVHSDCIIDSLIKIFLLDHWRWMKLGALGKEVKGIVLLKILINVLFTHT